MQVQPEPSETHDQEQMWGSDSPQSLPLQSKEQMVNVQGLTETSTLSLGDTRSCRPYGHREKAVHLEPQSFSSQIVGQRSQGRLGKETELFPGPATDKRASGVGEIAQWLEQVVMEKWLSG